MCVLRWRPPPTHPPHVLMSVRQEIMRASLREPESVPRSCVAWAKGRGGGGLRVHPDPSFRGPICLSETISFLRGPFESLQCDSNVKGRGHLHAAATWWNRKYSDRTTSLNVLAGVSFTLQSCVPHPHATPHHHVPNRLPVCSCQPPNQQTLSTRRIANDGKQLRAHKRERPAVPLCAVFRLCFGVKWLELGFSVRARELWAKDLLKRSAFCLTW